MGAIRLCISKNVVVLEIVRLRRCERKHGFGEHVGARVQNLIDITGGIHFEIGYA